MKIKSIKREVTQYMENQSKKNQTETQNTVGVHSSRLEQLEGKISKLEDKTEIKEKAKDILAKQLKSSESNMQELSNLIKRSNLRIMGIEEEEEVQENRYVIYSIK
jgi:septal ring factor EnvC (AmiA/AmiB activator)